jgi:NADH-quinone oxidoreductase subunit C
MEPLELDALAGGLGGKRTPLGIEVPREALIPALTALREAGCRYYLLCTVTEVAAGFEIVHGLRDVEGNRTVFVKTSTGKDDPRVPSAVSLFAGANWFEREMLDLFGVVFEAHPDPRRLMMPDDYPGHPLRKDFAMATAWGYRPATEPEAP